MVRMEEMLQDVLPKFDVISSLKKEGQGGTAFRERSSPFPLQWSPRMDDLNIDS